jgi:hypothetical protein
MAFQTARSKDPAGVGYGIFVLDLTEAARAYGGDPGRPSGR